MDLTHKHVGYGLIGVGVVVQLVSAIAEADATLNNIPYESTSVGALVSPFETALHIPGGMTGWVLIATGLGALFLYPLVRKVV